MRNDVEQDPAPSGGDGNAFALSRNRLQLLRKMNAVLETPMALLGLAWFCLMVVDLTRGLSAVGQNITTFIWVVFIVDFAMRLTLAPRKLIYIKKNWLTVVALLLPALRVLRFSRVLRSLARLRGLPLVRILASINRSMRALGETMQRRGFGYVMSITLVVTLAGAAGMLHFEGRPGVGNGIDDFWSALWWTGMMMTTMGSEYWPRTGEGRVLCMFLAIYAFAVFGYVTGTIATYFIGRDHEAGADTVQALRELQAEVARLRTEISRHPNREAP
ncbi:potassium channel family protein [Massilia scottii]|uniref:potassium channel family protein n=1 Tax=Massilia scottii TaxID=3057166 RepID=UPI0027969338|nr:potassium channel family protein [Massilia sp. CCM 9029]MDQ1833729.1 ion transporter [Massilia sp. CCM 9029]